MKGTVFNIQHFSTEDGPGIRTVVFVKGCPLRCKWCGNPESQSRKPELAWIKKECIGCKSCEKITSAKVWFEEDGLKFAGEEPDLKEVKRACPTEALHVIGKEMNTKEVMAEVMKDAKFYDNSQGGITISGGEPLLQGQFVYSLLKAAKEEYINTAIETCGFGDIDIYKKIASKLDILLTDVKVMDDEVHKAYTGVSNRIILENLMTIRETYPDLRILVRTPVIPGVNDSEKAIGEIVDFLASIGIYEHQLLEYHRLGVPKLESLGRTYEMGDVDLAPGLYEHLKEFAAKRLEEKKGHSYYKHFDTSGPEV